MSDDPDRDTPEDELDVELEDTDELDELDDVDFVEEPTDGFDRSRTDYTGVDLDDEFQPLDEVELEEEGMELDDPELIALLPTGADDPDGIDLTAVEESDDEP